MALTDSAVQARVDAVKAQREDRARLIEQFRDMIRPMIREELREILKTVIVMLEPPE